MDKNLIAKIFGFTPGRNQTEELKRLFWEIARREGTTPLAVMNELAQDKSLKNAKGPVRFQQVKGPALRRRFPLADCHGALTPQNAFLPALQAPIPRTFPVKRDFVPEAIIIEKEAQNSKTAHNFIKAFPGVKVRPIKTLRGYTRENPFSLKELKRPLVFIVKERFDHFKPCPCTKGHVRCGYWIINLGFGCPFDCSYCYLQHYSNVPGIIVPANFDDFFKVFDETEKNLAHPIRVGTGEFTDSLALDHITQYSIDLLTYFADKKAVLELKTKSDNIGNLLKIPAPANAVIAWSLNREEICGREEFGCATLDRRLAAAARCRQHGYKIAFHFDPVVYGPDWEKAYKKTIDKIYDRVKPPLAWISLGTLRCHRDLKVISERRFSASRIFLGELLLGEDKKLRYPEFLRKRIYLFMLEAIRLHDKTTPLYLCMETKKMWREIGRHYPLPRWTTAPDAQKTEH